MSDQMQSLENELGDDVETSPENLTLASVPKTSPAQAHLVDAAAIDLISGTAQKILDVTTDEPLDDDFTTYTLLFASTDGSSAMPGSLYFSTARRIRLVHNNGPEISTPKTNMRRYCLNADGIRIYREICNEIDREMKKQSRSGLTKSDIKVIDDCLKANRCLSTAQPGTGGVLLELWDCGRHISRGRPISMPLNQYQINVLYVAAQWGNNALMTECYRRLFPNAH